MSATHLLVLLFWAATALLWAGSVWGSWAVRLYEHTGPDSFTWYWLRVFNVPRTRDNCVRFVRVVSLVGIGLVSVATTIILLTQP
jgi:hypothetical protein